MERLDPQRANAEREELDHNAANIKLSFVGANPHPRIEPFDALDTVVSYFIGKDPDRWRPNVSVWGSVRYVDLYPGVDLEVTSDAGQMVQRLVPDHLAQIAALSRQAVERAVEVAVQFDEAEFSLPSLSAWWMGSASRRPSGKRCRS